MKQKWKMILTLVMCFTLLQYDNSFAYDGKMAASYARTYAMTPNNAFYNFGSVDCTNFVSQCVMTGGLSMRVNSDFKSTPNVLRKYINDTSKRHWYMKKVSRKIGYDYWQYSNTWSGVKNFYNYNLMHVGTAIIKRYNPNNTKSMESLKENAKVGDVLQVIGDKEQHSVIITKKKNNTLYYSQHSEARQDEDISRFISFAKKSDDNPQIIRIQY